jgi:hypothetical protein
MELFKYLKYINGWEMDETQGPSRGFVGDREGKDFIKRINSSF